MRTLAPREIAIAGHERCNRERISWTGLYTGYVTECRPLLMPSLLTSQAVPEPPALQLDLPDPDRDDISTMEFLARLEQAWAVCDRFDLQTEIWRGRILKSVRDREKRGGEGRGEAGEGQGDCEAE